MKYLYKSHKFNFQEIGKKVLKIEISCLKEIEKYINYSFQLACEFLLKCKGKVILMGMGKSGHIAKKIASTFSSMGTSSFFVHPGEANHGDLGMITIKDIVIILSNSGESKEISSLIPFFKFNKIKIICITSKLNSTIGKIADINLCTKISKEACLLKLAPTSSTTAMLVMGDALAIALSKAKNFKKRDFALFHPGGILGRKLLMRVSDVMNINKEIPCINKKSSLLDVVLKMIYKNFKTTIVVDDDMNIEGVFNKHNLNKIFNMNINLKTTNIIDFINHEIISVCSNTLLKDAFILMKNNKMSSVIVSDNKKLLGILSIKDIIHIGVF